MRALCIAAFLVMLTACSSQNEQGSQSPASISNPSTLKISNYNTLPIRSHISSGDYQNNENAERFIEYMVAKHNYDRDELVYWLSNARRLDFVINLMDRQAPSKPSTAKPRPPVPTGAWLKYRKQFITPSNVQNGVAFWQQHKKALDRAYQVYGVPPEIIVGIIGVETRWGRVLGKTRLLDALATLAFDYPRRSEYFSGELETFLLMARDQHVDAHELRGSFAGAMGYCQFMPSSYRAYAVDFDGDGHINLWDADDAIGSVAHYFQMNGWVKGDSIAVRGFGQAPGLKYGFENRYPVKTLSAAGLRPTQSLGAHQEASVLRLDVGTGFEYWYGLPNFYAITRYNRSVHYSMAVWQLGAAVKQAVSGDTGNIRVVKR